MYLISAVRLDEAGQVSHVRWRQADGANVFIGATEEVSAHVVANELAVGNAVLTWHQIQNPDTGGIVTVVGVRPMRLVLAGGHETIANPQHVPEGRGLLDLPRF